MRSREILALFFFSILDSQINNLAISKVKKLNNVNFLCTKFFQKGDTIQGGTLFKEIQYV